MTPLVPLLLFCVLLITLSPLSMHAQPSVRDALAKTTHIAVTRNALPVVHTTAQALAHTLCPGAAIHAEPADSPPVAQDAVLRLTLEPTPAVTEPGWLDIQLNEDGSGTLRAAQPHLLYTAFTLLRDDWADRPVQEFARGHRLTPRFRWITGRDDLLTGRRKVRKHRTERIQTADIEAAMRELARLGCSAAVVNELAGTFAHETGPEGEIYYRFYDYLPDLDQFVDTRLNAGTYPREYLQANLASLEQQARLAAAHGLVPGLHVANPRSVPETLLKRYPWLRGARVDHPFRSFFPRYTLSVAHPAVRWHYAELLRTLLREVPQLGFFQALLNDSGSGFEYTASLYPGRNGGPYVVREWQPDAEIARKAAENVVRYYRTLRDAAHETHPHFRIITGLKNIAEEAEIILAGMDHGLDRQMRTQRSDIENRPGWLASRAASEARGSMLHAFAEGRGCASVIGVPAPWQTWACLQALTERGFTHIEVDLDPPALVERDVNREAVRTFQLGLAPDPDAWLPGLAERWVGQAAAPALLAIWHASDRAVAAMPVLPLYGGLGFTWYRFWVRPFVPDIDRIPEAERAYYEDHCLTTFNNPHRIDLGADMLWEIHGQAECDRLQPQFDAAIRGPLVRALELARHATEQHGQDTPAGAFFPGDPGATAGVFPFRRD